MEKEKNYVQSVSDRIHIYQSMFPGSALKIVVQPNVFKVLQEQAGEDLVAVGDVGAESYKYKGINLEVYDQIATEFYVTEDLG